MGHTGNGPFGSSNDRRGPFEAPVEAVVTGHGVHPSVHRLKCLIRDELPGRCKMFSHGEGCECGLCDADRLQETLEDCLSIINDCILRGMPVTEQVAKVSNQIRGMSQ